MVIVTWIVILSVLIYEDIKFERKLNEIKKEIKKFKCNYPCEFLSKKETP